jgi:hypothetical protein
VTAGGRGEFEIACARADDVARGAKLQRTIVTGPGHFVDELVMEADHDVQIDLPIHFDGDAPVLQFTPRRLSGGDGLEDGFDFVIGAEATDVPARTAVHLEATRDGRSARLLLWCDTSMTLYRAVAPGQPAAQSRRFHLARVHSTNATLRSVWSWTAAPLSADFRADEIAATIGANTYRHRISLESWAIDAPGAQGAAFTRPQRSVARPTTSPDQPIAEITPAAGVTQEEPAQSISLRTASDGWYSDIGADERAAFAVFELGELNYRRTEDSWLAAGEPRARVAIAAEPDSLVIDVAVETATPFFVPRDAVNPYDNEEPDINGHGLQLYIVAPGGSGAWVIVPERPGSSARVRPINGWGAELTARAEWRPKDDGFDLRVRVGCSLREGDEFRIEAIVNDAVPSRARRRGQLVMTGAQGEFAYLRGDRHDRTRLAVFRVR